MIIDLELIDYEEAYKRQREIVAKRKLGEVGDTLILAEHNAVFTIGRSGADDNLLADEEELARQGIRVLHVDRGGDITFHGRGQLVAYPIIDLKQRKTDLHQYLRDLEEVVIRFLNDYGLTGKRIAGKTGVWVDDKKIASIGIAASGWVTYHGLSINLNTDLEFFSMINPCGMKSAGITSLAALLGRPIDMEEAKGRLSLRFDGIFKPSWLKKRLRSDNENLRETKRVLTEYGVETVCESSLCPNVNECFSERHVTFLILGKSCTRACGFCRVEKRRPSEVDPREPERMLEAVKALALRYVIITSVTRDDLADQGAGHFVKSIEIIKNFSNSIAVEVLTPDFGGERTLIEKVALSRPDVFAHNIETVKRLYPIARNGSDYDRSIRLLRLVKGLNPNQLTKSGMMLGLGETMEEVVTAMKDLRLAGCDLLTLGQYLRPGPDNIPVERFLEPGEFESYRRTGLSLGFKDVNAGPFVRSSYFAEKSYQKIKEKLDDKCCAAVFS